MKKIWGVRHIRWFFLNWGFQRHCALWQSLGYFPRQEDYDYLKKVWIGEE